MKISFLTGVVTLCVVGTALAQNTPSPAFSNFSDPTTPPPPAVDTVAPASQTPPTPYATATPTYEGPGAAHAEKKKPFTVFATIREVYDDNIFTTHDNKTDQFETVIEPSILFNYPMDQTLFQARYTFGATYYPDRAGSSFDLSHDFLGRINHSFSDRFNIDARDRVLNTDQPQVSNGATVNRVAGSYTNNTFTLQGTAQWMPKFNTVTTYTNDYFAYDDPTQSVFNDRDVNTLQHDFDYLLTPVLTLVAGGIFNDVSYDNKFTPVAGGTDVSRDWTSYTGYVGANYNLTPELQVSGRLGAVESEYDRGGSDLEPYGEATINWQIGARSSLAFDYTHTATQTDINFYSAAISDSFSLTGRYQFTPKISGRIQGSYSQNTDLANAGVTNDLGDYHEDVLGIDVGVGYDLTRYLNLNLAYTFADITSDNDALSYTRNQISLGLTATY